MKVIVGLGNPGFRYEKTRHNVGFMVVDRLSKDLSLPLKKKKCQAKFGIGEVNGEKTVLLKPLTYMNASGEAVRAFLDYFGGSPEEIVVIYDDLDLPPGKIRLRPHGGAGGHNGMKSVISHLGTKQFKRIRIGIGHPGERTMVMDYVLKPFPKAEREAAADAVERAAQACRQWIDEPFERVMNTFNR
ncbi:MAG TPA: aminoacyl-tRNA hydrolase [Bacillales bacterium]|nr:aminoacyl-tRNA hydrolase [Bacillales bacterium]